MLIQTSLRAQSIVVLSDKKESHFISYLDDMLVEQMGTISGGRSDTFKLFIHHPTIVKVWKESRRNVFLIFPHDTLYLTPKSDKITYAVDADSTAKSFLNWLEFSDSLKTAFHTTYRLKAVDSFALASLYTHYKKRITHQRKMLYNFKFSDSTYTELADQELTSYCLLELLEAYKSEITLNQNLPSWYTDSLLLLKNTLFLNDTTLGGSEHRRFLIEWNLFLYSIFKISAEPIGFDSLYNHVNKVFKGRQNDYVKAYLLFFYKNKTPNEVLNHLSDFYSSCSDKILYDFIRTVVDDSIFSYPEFAKNTILETNFYEKTTWADILKSKQGKLILVKLTASWCPPCIGDIPYLDRLRKEYTGKPIEFISISIDKNRKQWKQMLAKYEERIFDSTAYWLGSSKRFVQFLITRDPDIQVPLWIPRYILIKRDGTVASLSTPRPSSDNSAIKKLIDLYLSL